MRRRAKLLGLPLLFGCSWLVLFAVSRPATGLQSKTPVNFSRDVLPILSDNCFKCHGPDADSRKAGLRLDSFEGATAVRRGHAAIVPFKPDSGLLFKRITSHDDPMPPADSGKSLTEAQINTLKRWIAEGAKYARLWSFEPLPKTVAVPKVKSTWPLDDIDRFVLDRLTKEKLSPSLAASKARWLRRVTLDLTGLPPTEDEISSFENDKSDHAFEKVVDRLLASPHFGERLAVQWLDAARYSDSYGYQSDLLMPTWPYRDWVIKSFNENLPYDQFLTQQIAGDLLPNATRDQKLATAFNRLHRQSNEGGSIAPEFKTEYAVDRVDTFGTAVLGLTLGCARCHDHKFDPITQKEYYQLFAYFNSIEEYGLLLSTEIVPTPSLLLPTKEQEVRLAHLEHQRDVAKKFLRTAENQAAGRYQQFLAHGLNKNGIPKPLCQFNFDSYQEGFQDSVGKFVCQKLGNVDLVDGVKGKAVFLSGDNGIVVKGLPGRERWDEFTWSFWVSDPRQKGPVVLLHRTGGTDVGFCGFDLMVEDGYLTARVMRHWPGNAIAIRSKEQIPKDQWTQIAWSWDGFGEASGLKLYRDGQPLTSTVLVDKLWKKINAYGDLGPSGGDWSFGQRFRDAGFKGGKIDGISFSDRALSEMEVAQLFDGATFNAAKNSHSARLKGFFLSAVDKETIQARSAVRKAEQELAEFQEGIREISVMEESPTEVPAYLLFRGQYDAPRTDANRVERGVPKSLPNLKKESENNRLSLAKWVTSSNHPLTSRVAVNRFWQMLFGTGFVETSENFGSQGSQPTHPELLDFLARRFVDSGWNVKKLLRDIVLSATYRQDSVRSVQVSNLDPNNRLLARGPSSRLSAEMVRDTALAAAGLLNKVVGGPPVNPYQPAGIWQENNTMSPGFVQSTGQDLYRRSLYSTWKRTTPVPNMMLFDATSREACTIRRPSTNTPLQALVLLNDVQFVEAARVLAERLLHSKGNDELRIQEAFIDLAGRSADQKELTVLKRELEEQRAEFRADAVGARKLVNMGDSRCDPALSVEDLAAMTVTVQTILNSDAVIWKR